MEPLALRPVVFELPLIPEYTGGVHLNLISEDMRGQWNMATASYLKLRRDSDVIASEGSRRA